jgi:uncharacterized membrane protein
MTTIETTTLEAWDLPRLALATALAGLGVLSIVSADFAFQWQPVPATLANRAQWAMASGLVEVLVAIALAGSRTRIAGAYAASIVFLIWALLHIPEMRPSSVASWLSIGEPFSIFIACLLFAISDRTHSSLADICVRLFGIACIAFGVAHFAYAEFTASMVPEWLPERLALAYLTGVIHAGTGLALLIGVRRGVAATLEAMMMSSFVLLVHVPRVLPKPEDRMEWTMLLVALALSSSAWLVARHEFRGSRHTIS